MNAQKCFAVEFFYSDLTAIKNPAMKHILAVFPQINFRIYKLGLQVAAAQIQNRILKKTLV